jgi:hypothetical protein
MQRRHRTPSHAIMPCIAIRTMVAVLSLALMVTTTTIPGGVSSILVDNPSQLVYGISGKGTEPGGGCGTAGGGCMSVSANNVYVAWWSNKTGHFEVKFRASHDNGNSFDSKINLSNATSPTTSTAAVIESEGSNIYVAWLEGKSNQTSREPFDIIFRASNDNGKTFGPKINLSNSPNSNSTAAQIELKDNNVHVVWWERNLNQTFSDPAFRVSHDNGATFGPVMKLAANGTISSSTSSDVGVT